MFRLPLHPKKWFILAAASYLTGALGFEALGGWRSENVGEESSRTDLLYRLLSNAEESLEMVGLVLVTYALLELIRLDAPFLRVRLNP